VTEVIKRTDTSIIVRCVNGRGESVAREYPWASVDFIEVREV
jgi:hypothetical protein